MTCGASGFPSQAPVTIPAMWSCAAQFVRSAGPRSYTRTRRWLGGLAALHPSASLRRAPPGVAPSLLYVPCPLKTAHCQDHLRPPRTWPGVRKTTTKALHEYCAWGHIGGLGLGCGLCVGAPTTALSCVSGPESRPRGPVPVSRRDRRDALTSQGCLVHA